MSHPQQMTFQDAASHLMGEFHHFHDFSMIFVVAITMLIIYVLSLLLISSPTHWKFTEKQQVELWWTMSPGFVLMALAIPSMNLLYWMDEGSNPNVTIKTMGHQWYWSYEMWDKQLIVIDSYMIHLENLTQEGLPRLLEVDNRLVIPYKTDMRIITYSTDVMHAWSVPQLGLKMDAVPGRLNQVFMKVDRPGMFYGQCSEICGANHSFMPMVVEAVNKETYHNWCSKISES